MASPTSRRAPALPGPVAAQLESIVGRAHFLDDPEVVRTYTDDWTGRLHGSSAAVVRPGDAAEVAAIARVCAEHGIAIVPQGGNTGLVGGSVAFDVQALALSEDDLHRSVALLQARDVTLWAVISQDAATRSRTRAIGLADHLATPDPKPAEELSANGRTKTETEDEQSALSVGAATASANRTSNRWMRQVSVAAFIALPPTLCPCAHGPRTGSP